jgi:hypothetical protein
MARLDPYDRECFNCHAEIQWDIVRTLGVRHHHIADSDSARVGHRDGPQTTRLLVIITPLKVSF